MSEEQSPLQKNVENHASKKKEKDFFHSMASIDIEKQAPLKKESEFFQSLASLASLGTINSTRIPEINGVVILIYVVFSVEIVVGMVSLKSCPLNVMIPIYLILAGSTGIAINVLMGTTNRYLFNILMALISFYCIWLVVGSYIVFREFHPNYNPEEGPYCNRLPYFVAFWLLILQYVLFVVFTLLYVCTCLMRRDTHKSMSISFVST